MTIGIDMRMAGGGAGISRYITELAGQILAKDRSNRYVLFFNRLDGELRQRFGSAGCELVETGIGHYSLAEQLRLPGILRRHKLDLMHFPHFNVPLLYRGPYVVTIHDLTHTKFPGRKKSHLFHRLAYNLVLHSAVRRAKRIIAVSGSTKQEVVDYFKPPESRVTVVYEGADPLYRMMDKEQAFAQASAKYKMSRPFLLYVGVWRRYKNLPRLAQVFDRMVDAGFDFDLVLAGQPDPFYPEIQAEVMAIKHADRIKAVGRVSDRDLMLLYNASRLFVLPSLAEGFGLTALEAASCGAAIAASDIPTLREVLGQGAVYFDPENSDNIYDVVTAALGNETRLEELANLALGRSKHFSWGQAAAETIAIYESSAR